MWRYISTRWYLWYLNEIIISMAKVVEQCHVSPPAGSVPETCLPLTFFDVPWLLIHPTKRVYLYPLSQSHDHSFLIPSLKHSLSLALRHFFPFAGNLITPPPPEMPCIHFSDGDSVSFTVAKSAGDFDSLFSNHPRHVPELHSLVPNFPPARVDGDTRVSPLMALQVRLHSWTYIITEGWGYLSLRWANAPLKF